jgi:hypothetical protein
VYICACPRRYPGGDGTGSNSLLNLLLNATWLQQGIMTGSDAQACIDTWQTGPQSKGLELYVTVRTKGGVWEGRGGQEEEGEVGDGSPSCALHHPATRPPPPPPPPASLSPFTAPASPCCLQESSASWSWQLPPPAQNTFLHGFFTLSAMGQYVPSPNAAPPPPTPHPAPRTPAPC